MFLVSLRRCLRSIHWSQVLSWEWRCSWSSADRRCSNYIWVINNFIAYKGATYIRGFTVGWFVGWVNYSKTPIWQAPTPSISWILLISPWTKWLPFRRQYFQMWNCPLVNVTWGHWCPGNCLVLSGFKPLTEPMWTLLCQRPSLGHSELILCWKK